MTENQVTAGEQRIVKKRDDPDLQHRFKIDQQVSAADQIHSREWRIAQQIVLRENAHFANGLVDAIAVFDLREKVANPFRRDVSLNVGGVNTGARAPYAGFTHVRPEQLDGNLRRSWDPELRARPSPANTFLHPKSIPAPKCEYSNQPPSSATGEEIRCV